MRWIYNMSLYIFANSLSYKLNETKLLFWLVTGKYPRKSYFYKDSFIAFNDFILTSISNCTDAINLANRKQVD